MLTFQNGSQQLRFQGSSRCVANHMRIKGLVFHLGKGPKQFKFKVNLKE